MVNPHHLARGVVQANISANHGVIVLEYHRDSTVSEEILGTGEGLCDDGPDVPTLVDCEVLHDFDQVINDDFGEGALASEADNEMISMTENWVCHLLFRLEMTFISLTFQPLSCKCESDRDW